MLQKKQQNILFIWQGLNKDMQKIQGEIESISLSRARLSLRHRGIIINRIRRKPKPLFSRAQRIKPIDVSFSSRQLATMVGAGIPILQAVQAIGRGNEKPAMGKLLLNISQQIEAGSSFSNALKKHPQHFNRLFVSLVQAGEESGKLDIMLDRVATYNEKLEAIKGKVRSALMYPISVLVIAFLVTLILLLFVIPQFEALFHDFGAELPFLTRQVVELSELVQQNWLPFTLILFGASIIFCFFHRRSRKLQNTMDKLYLRLPIIGSVLKKSALARFSRTLSITFGAGVPLVDAMDTVGASTGNYVYQRATRDVKNDIRTGRSLPESMRFTGVFPNMMLQMVSSGEEAGELELMLDKMAEYYEREVDDTVDSLSSLIEPIMILILGIIIGTMVLAMYLPIFEMASVF